jgi:hypothetical protein
MSSLFDVIRSRKDMSIIKVIRSGRVETRGATHILRPGRTLEAGELADKAIEKGLAIEVAPPGPPIELKAPAKKKAKKKIATKKKAKKTAAKKKARKKG